MLKLLCINSEPIRHENGIISCGEGLQEGEIYHADLTVYVHPNNKKLAYFIFELNDLKLISRFIPVSDIDEMELERNNKVEYAGFSSRRFA